MQCEYRPRGHKDECHNPGIVNPANPALMILCAEHRQELVDLLREQYDVLTQNPHIFDGLMEQEYPTDSQQRSS